MGSEPRPEQDRNSSLKEVSNNDVNEVKTRKTDSWAYDNTGDPIQRLVRGARSRVHLATATPGP